ncbi:LOW QUALITY PROTEIN: uncharacterized protein C4orf50 homolog [Thomomys bottae]
MEPSLQGRAEKSFSYVIRAPRSDGLDVMNVDVTIDTRWVFQDAEEAGEEGCLPEGASCSPDGAVGQLQEQLVSSEQKLLAAEDECVLSEPDLRARVQELELSEKRLLCKVDQLSACAAQERSAFLCVQEQLRGLQGELASRVKEEERAARQMQRLHKQLRRKDEELGRQAAALERCRQSQRRQLGLVREQERVLRAQVQQLELEVRHLCRAAALLLTQLDATALGCSSQVSARPPVAPEQARRLQEQRATECRLRAQVEELRCHIYGLELSEIGLHSQVEELTQQNQRLRAQLRAPAPGHCSLNIDKDNCCRGLELLQNSSQSSWWEIPAALNMAGVGLTCDFWEHLQRKVLHELCLDALHVSTDCSEWVEMKDSPNARGVKPGASSCAPDGVSSLPKIGALDLCTSRSRGEDAHGYQASAGQHSEEPCLAAPASGTENQLPGDHAGSSGGQVSLAEPSLDGQILLLLCGCPPGQCMDELPLPLDSAGIAEGLAAPAAGEPFLLVQTSTIPLGGSAGDPESLPLPLPQDPSLEKPQAPDTRGPRPSPGPWAVAQAAWDCHGARARNQDPSSCQETPHTTSAPPPRTGPGAMRDTWTWGRGGQAERAESGGISDVAELKLGDKCSAGTEVQAPEGVQEKGGALEAWAPVPCHRCPGPACGPEESPRPLNGRQMMEGHGQGLLGGLPPEEEDRGPADPSGARSLGPSVSWPAHSHLPAERDPTIRRSTWSRESHQLWFREALLPQEENHGDRGQEEEEETALPPEASPVGGMGVQGPAGLEADFLQQEPGSPCLSPWAMAACSQQASASRGLGTCPAGHTKPREDGEGVSLGTTLALGTTKVLPAPNGSEATQGLAELGERPLSLHLSWGALERARGRFHQLPTALEGESSQDLHTNARLQGQQDRCHPETCNLEGERVRAAARIHRLERAKAMLWAELEQCHQAITHLEDCNRKSYSKISELEEENKTLRRDLCRLHRALSESLRRGRHGAEQVSQENLELRGVMLELGVGHKELIKDLVLGIEDMVQASKGEMAQLLCRVQALERDVALQVGQGRGGGRQHTQGDAKMARHKLPSVDKEVQATGLSGSPLEEEAAVTRNLWLCTLRLRHQVQTLHCQLRDQGSVLLELQAARDQALRGQEELQATLEELQKEQRDAQLATSPLKAKLASLVRKCMERNRLITCLLRELGRHGPLSRPLSELAHGMVHDVALAEYAATFLAPAGLEPSAWPRFQMSLGLDVSGEGTAAGGGDKTTWADGGR